MSSDKSDTFRYADMIDYYRKNPIAYFNDFIIVEKPTETIDIEHEVIETKINEPTTNTPR